MRKQIKDLLTQKKEAQKITMLTAYDYSMARLVDQAGIDMILVGDSLANVVLGLESTTDIGMDEMIHHAKAVGRAVNSSFVVGDMPYGSYQGTVDETILNARRFIEEANCDAVKLEWFDKCPEMAQSIVQAGIPVIGHIGLTPQTAESFKVQGKDAQSAQAIIEQAKALEKSGCFSVVLECIPGAIAKIITEKTSIITIGIGAGSECDGQVLVTHDLLGLYDKFQPKFVKQYGRLGETIVQCLSQFKEEVNQKKFPMKEHTFSINEEQLNQIN